MIGFPLRPLRPWRPLRSFCLFFPQVEGTMDSPKRRAADYVVKPAFGAKNEQSLLIWSVKF
jgi:hypothetical protein